MQTWTRNATLASLLSWLAAGSLSLAAPLPEGLPPIYSITLPADISSNKHCVAMSPQGVLHLGSNDAVHTFDGHRWRHWPSPNGKLIRSLAHDGHETLYVGGYNHFGFLRKDHSGELGHTDLRPLFEALLEGEQFADIWEILISPDGVFFSGDKHLFQYRPDDGGARLWRNEGRFGGQVFHQEQTLVQFRGRGLKRYAKGRFELIPGGEALLEQVYALLPLPDGSLLLTQRSGQWMRFSDGQLENWPMPQDMPSSAEISATLVLPDGSLALGSADGKLHIYDPGTGHHRVFRVSTDFISGLALSRHGGLLVQSALETLHVSWPSPWLRIDSRYGLTGSITRIVPTHTGAWLVLGSSGALLSTELSQASVSGRIEFRRASWSRFESWDWLQLDAQRGLLAESYSLVEIRGQQRREISSTDLYPLVLRRSRIDPGVVYVGADEGLAIFREGNEGWQEQRMELGDLASVVDLHELDHGDLLLSVEPRGILRLTLDETLTSIVHRSELGSESGVNYGSLPLARLSELGPDGLFASTRGGFYRWTGKDFESSELGGLGSLRQPDELMQLSQSGDGTSWAVSSRRVLRREAQGEWVEEDIAPLSPGTLTSITHGSDGTTMIGGIGAILVFDNKLAANPSPAVDIRLRGVIRRNRDNSWSEALPLNGEALNFARGDDFFVFEYALPEFRRPELVNYRYRLQGYEDNYSPWGRASRITFSRLEPGSYQFQAEARDPYGRISQTPVFNFSISHPWYRSNAAHALWALLGLLLLWLLAAYTVRWRLARINADRERLSAMVEKRTAELAAANRKLRDIANIDGLTSVANRRRLESYLQEVWSDCEQRQADLSLLLIDVDHFKSYNDQHGHQAGDDALRNVASVLDACLHRAQDMAGRYGGEEFLCILPDTDSAGAVCIAEAMRLQVAAGKHGVTISIGVASLQETRAEDIKALIEHADRALYQAKNSGRDRVCQAKASQA